MKTFIFHVDPGHGWLEVDYSEIVSLGITDEISNCSYRKGRKCYLEEDCDAGIFAKAYRTKYGEILHKEQYCDNESPIRQYPRFWH